MTGMNTTLHNRGYMTSNCSAGQQWLWSHTWQCMESTQQIAGFCVGVIAIVIWSIGHICLYRFKRTRTRSSRQHSVRLFLMMNWFSDGLGCVGAGLAQQLSSQIMFGVTVTFVHTMCCIHSFIIPLNHPQLSQNKKEHHHKLHKSKRSLFKTCIYPLSMLLVAVSMVTVSSATYMKATARSTAIHDKHYILMPVEWVVGYVFGSMAGVLHCCAKMLDILDSYISVEFNRLMAVAYMCGILGEIGYIIGVLTQNNSQWFYGHTAPWVLPRLVAAGLDAGILLQRIIQKRRGKRRKLSEEDAECLLSSESDSQAWMSSDSEEVIWMPLKSVDLAIPSHPVCASRVQILSESDQCSDTVDWIDSPGIRDGKPPFLSQESKLDSVQEEDDVNRDDEDDHYETSEREHTSGGSDADTEDIRDIQSASNTTSKVLNKRKSKSD